jgi:hypothetical protein
VKKKTTKKLSIEKLQTNVPKALRKRKQWVAWRSAEGNGRAQKIPVDPDTGNNASVSNSDTWATFQQALEFYENNEADGIGFVLTQDDPFVVVDLDDCRCLENNQLTEDAWNYLEAQHSYAEASPSGVGLHVWVQGNVPRNIRRGGAEIYTDKRFMTVTGDWLSSGLTQRQIADGGASLEKLYKKLEDQQKSGGADSTAATKAPDAELERVIEAAGSGKNGAKFKRLWAGNAEGYSSKSEGDLALCRILGLKTGGDRVLMDKLFRRSALLRPKWDEVHNNKGRTYGQMTIAKARKRALEELKSKFEVRSADEVREQGSGESQANLIAGLIPRKSLVIVVGHSNLGKSPLLYQAGICIAAGVSFLGHEVEKDRVLYLDFENGSAQTDQLIRSISGHLGLTKPPEDFLCWNQNSSGKDWNEKGWFDMMRGFRPGLVIVDSLTAFDPEIENRNSNATQAVRKFRGIIREVGAAVLGTHHLVKPSSKGDGPEPLEKCKQARSWFAQARGASALINATDVRLGVEAPVQISMGTAPKEEIALVMRGFARIKGEIPLIYVARVFNKDGEPVGYKKVVGSRLLFNPDQESAFNKLPVQFRFKDAQHDYDRGPQATSDFLKKCIALGIIEKTSEGYQKLDTVCVE